MRRIVWSLALLVVAGCTQTPGEVSEPVETEPAVAAGPLQMGTGAPLTGAGAYLDPAWAPDGARVTFTGEGFKGLYAVGSSGGAVETLVEPGEISAFRHRWDGERIVVPQRGSKPAVEWSPASGLVREIDAAPGPVFELYRGDVYLGEVTDETRLTQGEDQFFDPVASPDGARVAVVGLTTGIHVLDLRTGQATAHPGPGTHPAWTPDGQWVLFERTGDDGHERTSGDLWAVRADTGETVQLTGTADAIEIHPSVSPDGKRVAYIRDDAVWAADLVGGGTP